MLNLPQPGAPSRRSKGVGGPGPAEPPRPKSWWTLPLAAPSQSPSVRPSPNRALPYRQPTPTTAGLADQQEDALPITRTVSRTGINLSTWGQEGLSPEEFKSCTIEYEVFYESSPHPEPLDIGPQLIPYRCLCTPFVGSRSAVG